MTVSGDDFSFGTLLHSFRKRTHLTQQQLAKVIGVHRRTLVRWEQGEGLPQSKALILELAHHLKLNAQETRQILEASLTGLAPYWYVPLPRNPFFTGRTEILEMLHTQIDADQAVALTQSSALHGLGGVGKTQIALEYVYRYGLEYSAVFWIGAETEEQIVNDLLRIAEVLQLPERADENQQRVVAAVQHWLISHRQWLLVWDNVEDVDLFQRFLPTTRSGALIITTRCQALGTLAQGLDLAPMKQEEGILFLLRRAKVLSPEATGENLRQFAVGWHAQYAAVSELVMALGGLPLALDQAGAYIEETQSSLSAYLDLFRTRRASLLKLRGQVSREHPASVSTTLTLTIAATAQRHPAIEDLLRVCTLLQADTIPEELFCQGGEHLGTVLAMTCHDPLEWDRVVRVACSSSLLSRQPEEQTLSMHRLVQAVLLDSISEEEREQWDKRVTDALNAVFPEIWYNSPYNARKQCERLLPHVLLSIHRKRETAGSLACASLDYKTACYLFQRGQLTEAAPLFQRALQVRERILGSEHLDVAFALNKLAVLSLNQGRFIEAERLFQRALQIQEQARGVEHPELATLLNNLAVLSWERGKYKEAEPLFQRALQIRERALGLEHPEVATSLNNLAELYTVQGRYPEAELLSQQALHILEQALGLEHPEVATSLYILANLLREVRKYKEAEALFQRALQIRKRILGPEHRRTVDALNDLAACYLDQGHYEQAEALFLRALHIREQTRGPDHPDVAESLSYLANLSSQQSKYEQAERFYQRALSLRQHHFGQQHPITAQTLHDLALFRQKQGKLKEALSLAQQAYCIRSQSLGEVHPKTVATRTLSHQLLQEQAADTMEKQK